MPTMIVYLAVSSHTSRNPLALHEADLCPVRQMTARRLAHLSFFAPDTAEHREGPSFEETTDIDKKNWIAIQCSTDRTPSTPISASKLTGEGSR